MGHVVEPVEANRSWLTVCTAFLFKIYVKFIKKKKHFYDRPMRKANVNC